MTSRDVERKTVPNSRFGKAIIRDRGEKSCAQFIREM
jgi:hypothetical protein